MKIGSHHVAWMYVVTIALLVAIAAVSAYLAGTFPTSLIVAVVACILIDLAVEAVKRHKRRIPVSAIITGLIIGSVAPITAPILLVVAASLVAELTKFFIKAKGRNVFNPAAVGLLAGLLLFGLGDEWWAASSIHAYGFVIPIAAILILAAYEAKRLVAGLSAAAVAAVGIASISGLGFSAGGIIASVLTVNYYFVFLMVADPKTSPNKVTGQLAYGVGVAALALLLVMARVPYPLLIALVLANVCYAAFRLFYRDAQAKIGVRGTNVSSAQ